MFHAASQWSFKACSRLIDMTFYSSVAENNVLVRDAKFYGTDGVIVPRANLTNYLDEVEAILLGPGLRRDVRSRFSVEELNQIKMQDLNEADWENDTLAITSVLLHSWPQKRWVIDAGSLQVMPPDWIPAEAILTPHAGELTNLLAKQNGGVPGWLDELVAQQMKLADLVREANHQAESLPAQLVLPQRVDAVIGQNLRSNLHAFADHYHRPIVLLKGAIDLIWDNQNLVAVAGGNAGLTKGGTGDALAGLILGWRATSPALATTVVAAWINKQAAHQLYRRANTMYNTSDLVDEFPKVWAELVKRADV